MRKIFVLIYFFSLLIVLTWFYFQTYSPCEKVFYTFNGEFFEAEEISIIDTHSMQPLITTSSEVHVAKQFNPDDIKVCDIILFDSSKVTAKSGDSEMNTQFLHRVIYANSDDKGRYFITKGDNDIFNDEILNLGLGRIYYDQIEGVVVSID